MTTAMLPKRLGFFTRLLDQADPAERYRLATAQIIHAERCGFDSAWVAQHHFHEDEGGLPAPFVFLGQVAAPTSRIRLGTGIVTLPLELPIRVAEDAAVLDLISGGRLEVGVGGGGNLSAYAAFGQDSAERGTLLTGHLTADLGERWNAIVAASVALTATPTAFGPEHVDRLRSSGLDDLAIADVIHAAAFFNWANRLMLSLGEPAAGG